MIQNFADRRTSDVWHGRRHPKLTPDEQRTALRKLRLLNNARSLTDLRQVPGNRLEALKRDRAGQHSIRLEDRSRWRICFVWEDSGPDRVEIVDYHVQEGPRE